MSSKARFTGKLITVHINGRRHKLGKALRYICSNGDVVIADMGFISDFASIPWPARMLLPRSGPYNPAAVIHDWLYEKQVISGDVGLVPVSRLRADQIFLEAMRVCKVPVWKRRIMYRGVRLGGWAPWANHKRKKRRQK